MNTYFYYKPAAYDEISQAVWNSVNDRNSIEKNSTMQELFRTSQLEHLTPLQVMQLHQRQMQRLTDMRTYELMTELERLGKLLVSSGIDVMPVEKS